MRSSRLKVFLVELLDIKKLRCTPHLQINRTGRGEEWGWFRSNHGYEPISLFYKGYNREVPQHLPQTCYGEQEANNYLFYTTPGLNYILRVPLLARQSCNMSAVSSPRCRKSIWDGSCNPPDYPIGTTPELQPISRVLEPHLHPLLGCTLVDIPTLRNSIIPHPVVNDVAYHYLAHLSRLTNTLHAKTRLLPADGSHCYCPTSLNLINRTSGNPCLFTSHDLQTSDNRNCLISSTRFNLFYLNFR